MLVVVLVVMAAAAMLPMLVVVLVVVTAAAMLPVLMMVLMLMAHLLQHLCFQPVTLFHCVQQLRCCELVPRRCNNRRFGIALSQQCNGTLQPCFVDTVCTGQNNCAGVFNLVVVKLTEVFRIQAHLVDIGNRYKGIQLHIRV